MRLTRDAHAKVNLALDVAAPLASGLHPIASWMAPIDLRDTLTIERRAEGSPAHLLVAWAPDAPRPSPIDWAPEKDLAIRALRAIEAEIGRSLPAHLEVRKRIPVGGGLGGGSSDAAAALWLVRACFELRLTDADLRRLAMTLGSDVAFFCADAPPRPAIVEGLGDVITRVPRVMGRLLLVAPSFGCATGAVYKAFDALPGALPSPRADAIRSLVEGASGVLRGEGLFNALAPAACAVQPRLKTLLNALAPTGRWHVTGSGSCCFCVDERADLEGVRRVVAGVDPGAACLRVALV